MLKDNVERRAYSIKKSLDLGLIHVFRVIFAFLLLGPVKFYLRTLLLPHLIITSAQTFSLVMTSNTLRKNSYYPAIALVGDLAK